MVTLGESWSYYIGHTFADRTYGLNSSQLSEQGIGYANNSPLNGLSSHLNLLEDFSPFRTGDHFKWIPQGLFYDLNDPANELNPPNPVNDNVAGYTNQQMFNAFQSGIYTLQNYHVNLLQQNNNNQSVQVIDLFNQYHY